MYIPIIKPIDTRKLATALRRKSIDLAARKVLVTQFEGSAQSKDLTVPANCGGFGRIHHFIRKQFLDWPENPLPIDPACSWLKLPLAHKLEAQLFQHAACSWRCWYCFVDDELLSANMKRAAFKSAEELLDQYFDLPNRAPVIDLSGGQPDLVPEWIVWFADEIQKRGAQQTVYLWSDDNLSNEYMWELLSQEVIERLAHYPNYGKVGCFKGFDDMSFAFNTRARPEMFDKQFEVMRRYVKTGIDVYGYITFTTPSTTDISRKMKRFVDRLQSEVHPLFPLRTVPLKILEFSPTTDRLTAERRLAMRLQHDALHAWQEELDKRFARNLQVKPVHEHSLSR